MKDEGKEIFSLCIVKLWISLMQASQIVGSGLKMTAVAIL